MSLACVVAGCSTDAGSPSSNLVTSRIALSLPSGSNISSVSYRVLSSGNVTLVAGTIDLANSGAQLSLALVLAPGTGDSVQLSAQTSAGAACAGTSAPFDVKPGQRTFVSLTLVCGGDQPSSSTCPDIQSWSVMPVQAASPGGAIAANVTASDPDATQTLVYSWIATAGRFDDPSAPSTIYTCTTVGSQTLTLTVRDGPSTSVSGCAATATFLVDCLSTDDAGTLQL